MAKAALNDPDEANPRDVRFFISGTAPSSQRNGLLFNTSPNSVTFPLCPTIRPLSFIAYSKEKLCFGSVRRSSMPVVSSQMKAWNSISPPTTTSDVPVT